MANEPEDEKDDYVPADLGSPPPTDEAERRRLREEAEDHEVHREILLGKIAKARGDLYAAEQQGDVAKVAELNKKIDALTKERKDL
jgi:hypothetical protein